MNAWHSHLPPARGAVVSLGAFDGPECAGVVILSRPSGRGFDDGRTFEIVRTATNGYPNAASQLVSRARRVAYAMGMRRVVTYTLASEDGTTYRAAGFRETGRVQPREWKRSKDDRGGGRRRRNVVARQEKIRWEA